MGTFNQTHIPLILIVEDDGDASTIYSDYLTHNGYRTLIATNGEESLALAKTHPPDVALVDIRLPGMSGLEVAAWLREHQPEVKIIFITAFASTELAVEAMHRGAFYYLTKPVRPRQLLETVERAWAACQANAQVRVEDLVIDLREDWATLEGEQVTLTALESKLLVCLARRRGRKTSYDELWREVWDYDGPPDKGLIQRATSRLREKLGGKWIVCVRGQGYRLQ